MIVGDELDGFLSLCVRTAEQAIPSVATDDFIIVKGINNQNSHHEEVVMDASTNWMSHSLSTPVPSLMIGLAPAG